MLFNSYIFILFFLPVTLLGYFGLHKAGFHLLAKLELVLMSFWFYGYFNPSYLWIMGSSICVNYILSQLFQRKWELSEEKIRLIKKLLLAVGLIFNLGLIFYYKYYDFFVDNLNKAFSTDFHLRHIVLPLGISFYVFQSLTYTIDIYKRKMEPTNDIVAYFAFMSFFPQLLSGPIGRASRLIPQFLAKRVFDYDSSISGCRMILWGLFMKVCVADRLAIYVNTIYDNLAMHNGTSVALAAILYSFQIYGDFAGYSYMAIGTGRLLGIKLDENFHRPYFSDSISDFWRRWHISLSTWFRDYVYIPLGGNRVSIGRNYLNLFITFIASGLWHGAAWSFVFWGGLHGAYQILDKIRRKFTPKYGMNAAIIKVCGVVATFILVTFAWIFFRITDIGTAFTAISKIFTEFGHPFIDKTTLGFGVLSLMLLLFIEYIHESKLLDKVSTNRGGGIRCIRYIGALLLVLWIIAAGVFDGGQFIYFQF